MSPIPTKTEAYLFAQDVFFKQFNEVSFYVEDQDQENFYLLIIKKLFPKLKIIKIFPLDGKKNVIEHAKANQNSKKDIYITDKDYDDITADLHIQENVFYLNRYSIENFLAEREALIEYIVDEQPKLKIDSVKRKLSYRNFIGDCYHDLFELTILFVLKAKYIPESPIKSTSFGVERYCHNTNTSIIDHNKVVEYEKEIRSYITANRSDLKYAQIKRGTQSLLKGPDDIVYYSNVPGKHFLALIRNRLANLFDFPTGSLESFSYRLAKKCHFGLLSDLRRNINHYIES